LALRGQSEKISDWKISPEIGDCQLGGGLNGLTRRTKTGFGRQTGVQLQNRIRIRLMLKAAIQI
jgi:hypothetical protein